MPSVRSSSLSSHRSPQQVGHDSHGPMSLNRILRGPGTSPSIRSSVQVASTPLHTSVPADPGRTRFAPHLVIRINSSSADYPNLQSSPNPFLLSNTPTTPRAAVSYQTLFGDGPLTSPILGSSPTDRNPRALRRHGAVALLAPQTPSTPKLNILTVKKEDESTEMVTESAGHEPQTPLQPTSPTMAVIGTNTVFRLGDVEFLSFRPGNLPPSESTLLIQIDTKGISKADFAELIAFCSSCKTYMTRRSVVSHKRCGYRAHPAHEESPTKTLLRLLVTSGDHTGGISEAQFCALFSRCPHCFLFMTWDAARFHDCIFDAVENWGASDLEEESHSQFGSGRDSSPIQ